MTIFFEDPLHQAKNMQNHFKEANLQEKLETKNLEKACISWKNY